MLTFVGIAVCSTKVCGFADNHGIGTPFFSRYCLGNALWSTSSVAANMDLATSLKDDTPNQPTDSTEQYHVRSVLPYCRAASLSQSGAKAHLL